MLGCWIFLWCVDRYANFNEKTRSNRFHSCISPANTYDFSFLAPCPSSGLIINGENDRVVPSIKVSELVDKLQHQKGITISHEIIKKANHFFDPGMEEMLNLTKTYVQRRLLENTR